MRADSPGKKMHWWPWRRPATVGLRLQCGVGRASAQHDGLLKKQFPRSLSTTAEKPTGRSKRTRPSFSQRTRDAPPSSWAGPVQLETVKWAEACRWEVEQSDP